MNRSGPDSCTALHDAPPHIWDSGIAVKPRYAKLAFWYPAEEWKQPESEQRQEERGGTIERAVADTEKNGIEEER